MYEVDSVVIVDLMYTWTQQSEIEPLVKTFCWIHSCFEIDLFVKVVGLCLVLALGWHALVVARGAHRMHFEVRCQGDRIVRTWHSPHVLDLTRGTESTQAVSQSPGGDTKRTSVHS